MKTELVPMQVEDASKQAAGIDIPNFSEAGTGKTLTTVGAIERAKVQRGVIVCPPVATLMWRDTLEYELGAKAQWLRTAKEHIETDADFVVVSSGLVAKQQEQLREFLDGGALVVDECQQYKNADSQRTVALFGEKTDGEGGIYEASSQCWMLSGTPIERYYDDLWSMLRASHPQVLSDYGALSLAEFQAMFCYMEWKEYGTGVRKYVSINNNNARLLNKMLYEDIGAVRRLMRDVEPTMPAVRHRLVSTHIRINKEYKKLIDEIPTSELMDALLSSDSKAVTARRILGLMKVESVVEYVLDQKDTFPLLVGYWHQEVGQEFMAKMKEKSPKTKCAIIHGGTAVEERDRIRRRFMNGDVDVLFGQIAAMGMAMDGLQQAGRHVIFAEAEWSGAKVEQFYKRIARRGQTHSVQVDYCDSGEDLDRALYATARKKSQQADAALDG